MAHCIAVNYINCLLTFNSDAFVVRLFLSDNRSYRVSTCVVGPLVNYCWVRFIKCSCCPRTVECV